ncbi:hypothetical protein CCYA_CCYA03G0818 [Cyanidiococcus yangmingshanensis]|nr:hypothetical protein CCYA_CCYA03G0818 [Cyanidiococcus yangmingshanensis]
MRDGLTHPSGLVAEIRYVSETCRRRRKRQPCRWHRPLSRASLLSDRGLAAESEFLNLCREIIHQKRIPGTERRFGGARSLEGRPETERVTRDLRAVLDLFFEEATLLEFIYGEKDESRLHYDKAMALSWVNAVVEWIEGTKTPMESAVMDAVLVTAWDALRNSALYGSGTLHIESYFIWRLVHHGWGHDATVRQILRFYRQCRSFLRALDEQLLGHMPADVADHEPVLEHLGDQTQALVYSAIDLRSTLVPSRLRLPRNRGDTEAEQFQPNAHEAQAAVGLLKWNLCFLLRLPHALMRWIYGAASIAAYPQTTTFWWRGIADHTLVSHCVLDALLEAEFTEIGREVYDERLENNVSIMDTLDSQVADRSELLLYDPQAYLEAEWDRIQASLIQSPQVARHSPNRGSTERSGERAHRESILGTVVESGTDGTAPFSARQRVSRTPTSSSSLNGSGHGPKADFGDIDPLGSLEEWGLAPRSVTQHASRSQNRDETITMTQARFEPAALDRGSLCRILCVNGSYYICGGGIPCTSLSSDAR